MPCTLLNFIETDVVNSDSYYNFLLTVCADTSDFGVLYIGTQCNSMSHKRGNVPVYLHDRIEGEKGKKPAKLRLPEPNYLYE